MSLERVRAAVMDKVKAETAAALSEARLAADKLAADGKAEDDRRLADALREAKTLSDRELARVAGQIRQEGRMALLAAKNDRMDEVFKAARDQFLGLPDADRAAAAMEWIRALPADAGGVLRVNPRDRKALQAALPDLNQDRSSMARFASVEEDASIAGGALVDGADFTSDCTLDRRLEQLRESLAADLAGLLFS